MTQGPSNQGRVVVPVSYITSPLATLLHVLSLPFSPTVISILSTKPESQKTHFWIPAAMATRYLMSLVKEGVHKDPTHHTSCLGHRYLKITLPPPSQTTGPCSRGENGLTYLLEFLTAPHQRVALECLVPPQSSLVYQSEPRPNPFTNICLRAEATVTSHSVQHLDHLGPCVSG